MGLNIQRLEPVKEVNNDPLTKGLWKCRLKILRSILVKEKVEK